jgi:hypothetical protein
METIKVKKIEEKDSWTNLDGSFCPFPRIIKTVSEFEISGESIDDCLAVYFKEYSNRYKYCNDTHFVLDELTQIKFHKWISNVNNYMHNGGDMW